jgi:GntR family transcriptional regulator
MPEPRYQEIANDLRSKIESGELAEGLQLPTEKELAAEYDAARNTIREAINWLKGIRLVETRPGKGTFVVRKPQIFEVTLTPDAETGFSGGEGTAWIAEASRQNRAAHADKPVVEIKSDEPETALLLGLKADAEVVCRHQQRWVEGKLWSLQTSYYPMEFVDRGATKLLRTEDIQPGVVSYLAEKLGIIQVFYRDRISVRPPNEQETRVFDLPLNGSVQVFEQRRTAYGIEGKPFRFTVTVYPVDRNVLGIEGHIPPEGSLPTPPVPVPEGG